MSKMIDYDLRWKAEREARKVLDALGTRDPRAKYLTWDAQHYDELKEYDAKLASEIVKQLNKVSNSEIPNSSKGYKETNERKPYAD
jgi:hypothetical protein